MTIIVIVRRVLAFGLFAALTSQTVVVAQTAKYNDSYTIEGFSQPYQVSAVASGMTGLVDSRCVREGESVRQGDCLLKLDRSVHDAKVELARISASSMGDVDAAKAELNANKTRLKRIQELMSRQHATQVELLQAEELVAVSAARVRRAQDRIEQQKADYARLMAESKQYEILAPFDGVVVEFSKHKGEYVGPGDSTVCTVADLKTLSVEFLVPGHYRHNLAVDNDVSVIFSVARKSARGTIEYISPYPNGETNTYTVKVRVDNQDRRFNAGERCQMQGINQILPSTAGMRSPKVTMRK